MSREIKFRASHPKHGMFSAEQMSEDQLTLDVNGRGLVNVHSGNARLSEFYTHMIPMQWTGLRDKNGVDVYQGDIVEHGSRDELDFGVGTVEWDEQWACFELRCAYDWGDTHTTNEIIEASREWRIIGNRFEHPELLESAS